MNESKTPSPPTASPPAGTSAASSAAPRPNLLLRILRYERSQSLVVAVLALLLSLVAISIVILAVGKNPLELFHSLLQGSGVLPKPKYAAGKNMLSDFFGLLDAMTPMIFAALAVAIAFRAGLFNIGVSGQMLAAGFTATLLIGYSSLGAIAARPLVLLVGLAVGAAVGAVVGLLKARFNIHEVVTTIMLNYIIQYITSFFIKSYYTDPVSRQSRVISSDARLTLLNVPLGDATVRIPLCFLLAIAVAVLLYFLLKKTRLGFEIRAVGANRKAARYVGIKSNRTTVIAMALSGGCAGLAGVTYYLGCFNTIVPSSLTSLGFDSIAVALLGSSNPIACIFSSFLITMLTNGSTYMSSTVGVSAEIASLVVGIVLLFCACGEFLKYLINRDRFRQVAEESGDVDANGAAGGNDIASGNGAASVSDATNRGDAR